MGTTQMPYIEVSEKTSEPSDYTDSKKITQILEISEFFRNLIFFD